MKKLLLSLCFLLVVLTSAASVCACDVDNCSLGTDFSENNVENIAVNVNEVTADENIDSQISEASDNSVDDIHAGEKGYINANSTANINIYHNEVNIIAPENVSYSYRMVLNKLAICPILITDSSNYCPLPYKFVNIELNGVLKEFATNDLGKLNYVFDDLIEGPGNYTLKIIYQGESGYNPTFITNVEIYQEKINISQLENKELIDNAPIIEGIIDLYGSCSPKEIQKRLNVSDDAIIYRLLNKMRYGDFGEKYQKFILDKNEKMKKQIYELESYIVSSFTCYDYLSDGLPFLHELIQIVSNEYGNANVSTMASHLGQPENRIIEAIHEIKLGLYGKELKELFDKRDNDNKQIINKIDACIYTGAVYWRAMESQVTNSEFINNL